MPITPTYPGVYVEEIPSGVRTITGVSTSVTSFVGFTPSGPTDQPVRVFNFGEYERTFGPLDSNSPLSYAVSQFFRNGGGEAWIVRVASGAATASVTIENTTGDAVLVVAAASGGRWGNGLRVEVDYDTLNPDGTFNLAVGEYVQQGADTVLARTESFQNLSMNSESPFFVDSVVNAGSSLIRATRESLVTEIAALPAGTSTSGDITLADLAGAGSQITVSVDGGAPVTVEAFDASAPPANLAALATAVATAINNALGAGTVAVSTAGQGIEIESATTGDETSAVAITNAAQNDGAAVLHLGLANGGTETPAVAGLRPAPTGTSGAGVSQSTLAAANPAMELDLTLDPGAAAPATTILSFAAGTFTATTTVADAAQTVQAAIRASAPTNSVFSQATVATVAGALQVTMGGSPNVVAEFDTSGTPSLATALGLRTGQAGVFENVASYALGVGDVRNAQAAVVQGFDGTRGGATELMGSQADRTGIWALDDVGLFNLLCIPETSALPDPNDISVISSAAAYATDRRAFYILDPPDRVDSVTGIEAWVGGIGLSSKNAAVYFPRVQFGDPNENYRIASFAPSGTLAGLYARTDASRGVWKAAAGTEASLSNVASLAVPITDDENGVLNKLGINCLRMFPVYGRISWGARTTDGADQKASEWKYIPVRRTALYIEESLFRGLKWAVFEPNGEALWAQLRLAAGAFMHNLFRQGAFKGTSPSDAYFVKCDAETTTQNDIDLGIVNILIGFAPLKPAEFVFIKLQQMAGQLDT